MSRHLRMPVLGVLLALGSAVPAWSGPDDPRVSVQRLQTDDQQVSVSFRLDNAFDENLQRSIESGLPTGYTFVFQLVRARKGWFNNTLDSSSLQVDAMYNAVTREYLINYRHDGNLIDSRVVREPDELRQAMTEFSDFPAFSLEGRPPRTRLQVRVRADLGTRTILFFIPRRVATDWAVSQRFEIARSEDDGAP